MELRLLVIRTPNMRALAKFYTLLGFIMDYHSHGGSPMHYSGIAGTTVLEVYPLLKNQQSADTSLRLGFSIKDFDGVLSCLRREDVTVVQEPMQTDFGYMAVVIDPDGRKVELYKN